MKDVEQMGRAVAAALTFHPEGDPQRGLNYVIEHYMGA